MKNIFTEDHFLSEHDDAVSGSHKEIMLCVLLPIKLRREKHLAHCPLSLQRYRKLLTEKHDQTRCTCRNLHFSKKRRTTNSFLQVFAWFLLVGFYTLGGYLLAPLSFFLFLVQNELFVRQLIFGCSNHRPQQVGSARSVVRPSASMHAREDEPS